MTIWEALILGVVQGLAEFLPVSSSGHIIIVKEMFGIETRDLSFEVAVHAATVLSTLIVFRKDIAGLLRDLLRFRNNSGTQYIFRILVSMIPVMFVGLFLKDYVEQLFGEGLLVVGVALLCTALLLFFSGNNPVAGEASDRKMLKNSGTGDITFRSAFIIGVTQAVAVIPGLSRSGATISTGLLLGISREKIARFSFLMVLIPVLGEAFLQLISGEMGGESSSAGVVAISAGFLTAFITGLFACKAMISLVKKTKLTGFAIYCTVAGLFCIISQLLF
ncbi:MAG: undecaprenyl-diphosphate phosphatase [Bacteroidales bacterium]|jgi:undecaprenyl-diphosphatase|nr:undecaprenyl-diphosphate phosphatase [Bacteroidales bacterium]MDD2425023.1 undecaprenyl-diphosphate phosphatase [Bacteroidales bacterium]MDD3989336.1 undecaprenyl-diphosphate phosphatase [Bacteroidales bacterium]MDD4638686.1 undecaprenyl-diphosphate phosphatase [Bacteroidales bacterium]